MLLKLEAKSLVLFVLPPRLYPSIKERNPHIISPRADAIESSMLEFETPLRMKKAVNHQTTTKRSTRPPKKIPKLKNMRCWVQRIEVTITSEVDEAEASLAAIRGFEGDRDLTFNEVLQAIAQKSFATDVEGKATWSAIAELRLNILIPPLLIKLPNMPPNEKLSPISQKIERNLNSCVTCVTNRDTLQQVVPEAKPALK